MVEVKMVGQRKDGRNWVDDYECTDAAYVYERLATDLMYKYMWKSAYVTRITDKRSADGESRTVTAYQNNGYRMIYTIKS